MGDQHQRCSFHAVQVQQKLQHVLPVGCIEIACGLIGQHQQWPQDERARQGHALLLAAGKLHGIVVQPRRQPDRCQKLLSAIQPRPSIAAHIVQLVRKQHILERGQRGDQLVALEHEPYQPSAQLRQPVFRHVADVLPIQQYRPRRGTIQPGQ